jgi:WD40 repeat protein
MRGSRRDWALFAVVAVAVVAVFAALALKGGGAGATGSPSPASSVVAATPRSTATPLPAPTVAGTLVFEKVVDPGGRPLATPTPSPNGGWESAPSSRANYDLYLVRSDGTGLTRLTDDPGVEEHASWSPDGKRIVYGATACGAEAPFDTTIRVMNADGSGNVALAPGHAPHWSPDGKRIVYSRVGATTQEDVWVMDADGSGQRCVVGARSRDITPSWAPNGTIVFVRGGDLYAVNPDGSDLARLTRHAAMRQCLVSPDGTTVVAYRPGDLVAAPLQGDARPVTLLDWAQLYIPSGGEPMGAWTSDGRALVLGSSDWGERTGSYLYVVNADGSGLSQVPDVEDALSPAWQPRPVASSSRASSSPAVSYVEPPRPSEMTGFSLGTYGWQFRPTADIEITDLGCYDDYQDGIDPARRVGIFDARSDRLIASVTIGPQSALDGAFRWQSLGSRVILRAGRSYLAGAEYVEGDGLYDRTDGEVWAHEIALGKLVYSTSGFAAPHEDDNPWLCSMGPNFMFRPVAAASPSP